MSDIALDNAKAQRERLLKRKDELKAEMARVDSQLSVAEDFIHHWMVFAGVNNVENLNNAGTDTGPVSSPIRGHRPGARGNSKKEHVAAATREIITEYGEPMLRKELLPRLKARGLVIEGGDPDMVLSTMLWRAGDDAGVVRLKRGGYWLKERPWLPAGYEPRRETPLNTILDGAERMVAAMNERWLNITETVLADMGSEDIMRLEGEMGITNTPPASVKESLLSAALADLGREPTQKEAATLFSVFKGEVARQARELAET